MRLWHEFLLPHLPAAQLLGQHREVCALRGLGWGRKHRTVDYIFHHPYGYLFAYHERVMDEMQRRGFQVASCWREISYRGVRLGYEKSFFTRPVCCGRPVYPEHDEKYLFSCLENLSEKGIYLELSKKVSFQKEDFSTQNPK